MVLNQRFGSISMFQTCRPQGLPFLLNSFSMQVFLDESGDLGWKLGSPYLKSGSSQFFTLALLVVDSGTGKYPKRLVRKLRKKYGMKTSREIKGSELTPNQLVYFCEEVEKLRARHPSVKIEIITVMKRNVQPHIRSDSNKLYNYMINLCLPDLVQGESEVQFCPDPRTIKVASGNSMIDYLQTQLWFERGVETKLVQRTFESHQNLNLQFIDVIAHVVWSYHENSKAGPYRVLSRCIRTRQLFYR